MARLLVPAVAISTVLFVGLVHGYWTGRWEDAERAAASAAQLQQLPLNLGDWQGQDLQPDAREASKLSAYLYRRYFNQRTGAIVTVILASGRPGPVSIHTPDVCYVASGYESAQWQTFAPPVDPSIPRGEFKTAHFVKTKSAGQTHVRVCWSWNAGGTWSVPDNPRLAFARYPVLYKLHMVREMTGGSEGLEDDPSLELLRVLLVEFHKCVTSKS
jgi:hypothetical protein